MKAVKSEDFGKLVYSTGGNKGTFLDAFKEFNSQPFRIKKLAKEIKKTAVSLQDAVKPVLKPICDDYGVFGSRVKDIKKITGKLPRAINEMTLEDAVDWILKGKITNVVGDSYGTRIIVDDLKNVPKLLEKLRDLHKNKKIRIALVENYRGNGVNPYINGNNMRLLSEVEPSGSVVLNKIKNAGYTRTNMDLYLNDTRFEFQIGGNYTTRFGEIEHYLYDMRSNGVPDLSQLSKSQKDLFYKIKQQYVSIGNKKDKLYREYLTKIWKTLKIAEEKNKPFPQLPKIPDGISDILSAENLFKLEKKCKKL